MAQEAWLIHAVTFRDGAPAAAAVRTGQRAFDGKNELSCFGECSLEDAHIGDVERNRNAWMLGHYEPSFITGETRPDAALSWSVAQPLHLKAPTARLGEPKNLASTLTRAERMLLLDRPATELTLCTQADLLTLS